MKKYILLFAAALMAVFLSACGIERPDTVSYVLEAEPSRLDPAMTTALAESNTELQIFEGLTRLVDDVPQPALAKSWDVSADGKTYIFHLATVLNGATVRPLRPAISNILGSASSIPTLLRKMPICSFASIRPKITLRKRPLRMKSASRPSMIKL